MIKTTAFFLVYSVAILLIVFQFRSPRFMITFLGYFVIVTTLFSLMSWASSYHLQTCGASGLIAFIRTFNFWGEKCEVLTGPLINGAPEDGLTLIEKGTFGYWVLVALTHSLLTFPLSVKVGFSAIEVSSRPWRIIKACVAVIFALYGWGLAFWVVFYAIGSFLTPPEYNAVTDHPLLLIIFGFVLIGVLYNGSTRKLLLDIQGF